ncbi:MULTISPECIES: hypothetical protein [Acidaminococcus]|nr:MULTISPECIES: hypothetical protein [Acidaminococcus]
MSNMIVLVVCCLVTWVVFLDSHSIGMKHKNLWVLGTFLLMPVAVPLYLIRRAQFLYDHKLTPRQKREAQERAASRKRREKAEREKQQWEQQQRQLAQADPEEVAREKAARYREKHEMRLRLDEQLSNQQKRHARQWGIHRQ